MTNFIVVCTKPNESVVLCQQNTFLTHTHPYTYEHMNAHTNGMPLLHRTALLRLPKPLFASIEHLSWLTKQRALRQIINIITLHCEWDSNPAVGFKINCTLRRITHTESRIVLPCEKSKLFFLHLVK